MTDYTELVKALRFCQFGECGCGKCYYKELKGDWCTEDNHPEFFDCDDKLKLDAASAIEDLQAKISELGESYSANLVAAQNAQPRWVRVEDELPKPIHPSDPNYMPYLICDSLGYMHVADYTYGKYLTAYSFHVDGEEVTDVIYWMPIEPPGEDKQE